MFPEELHERIEEQTRRTTEAVRKSREVLPHLADPTFREVAMPLADAVDELGKLVELLTEAVAGPTRA